MLASTSSCYLAAFVGAKFYHLHALLMATSADMINYNLLIILCLFLISTFLKRVFNVCIVIMHSANCQPILVLFTV